MSEGHCSLPHCACAADMPNSLRPTGCPNWVNGRVSSKMIPLPMGMEVDCKFYIKSDIGDIVLTLGGLKAIPNDGFQVAGDPAKVPSIVMDSLPLGCRGGARMMTREEIRVYKEEQSDEQSDE